MKRLYQVKEPFQGYRIFMLSSALLHETVELQRETDWKWWKSDKGVDHQKIVEEIIDLWHFLIQLSIEAGIDPDLLVTKYMQKNRENTKRQESGY
ncbi:dUTPase [Candidatus Nitrosocosmicus sp. SS]|nr:dUTPase [Candidatus Nitrosocosmicus sp. SS]KAF0870093.1 dUTPase [Candidatus Nitrosocosmicus sp. SS]